MGTLKGPVNPVEPGTFAFADVVVDAGAHRLLRDGIEIPVEPKAFSVLLQFLAHPNELLGRDHLLDLVWGHSYVTPATLSRLVAQLRKALADDSENPRFIQTVHGLGYRFVAPLQHSAPEVSQTLRFAPPARARIPERTAPLIGRDHDIAELRRLLRENRLVTVTGPGGVGKTQAALEVARQAAAVFPDGVWLFDCTTHTEGDALVRGLAGMFDVHATTDAGQLMARLCELLQTRRVLLVFDNCERIAEPLGKALVHLLSACADLRILVTSQQRLNCAGEVLHGLPPLQMPPPGEWAADEQIASLSSIPAVQLLLLRSQACASGFALTRDNAATVAEICRRVAGLPLALELAAARLRLLSPEQLLARMDARLLNLAESNPGRPARHQTLRSLIEWSFALLSEREQSMLCGLSVFAGACNLGGATAMGAALGLEDSQTLELLAGLIDKSLLSVDGATNPPSYRLLDSVRLFAQERLAAGGSEVCMRRAHLAHFVDFTEHANSELLGDRQGVWHDRIRHEWTNLQAAFEFAMAQSDLASALALPGNLCWYLRGSNGYLQSSQWLERALQVDHPATLHRARALVASGMLLHHLSDHERAAMRLREGIALASDFGDTFLEGAAYAILAFELAACGDFAGAESCVVAALAIASADGNTWVRSNALLSRGIAHSLNDRHREAEASMSEAVECLPAQGDYFQQCYSLINRALQRFYLGDLPGAAQDWLVDLDVFFTRFQHWRGAAGCVEGTAYLAAELGRFEDAARFLAAAARVRNWTGVPLLPQWRKAQKIAERKAQEALGSEFKRAQQAGASARFEDVVTEARALLTEISAAQGARTGASHPSGS
ncbi:MAG TPA: winged helix-turn-helix domain-containing protein [Rhodanobacteraceae bacterium]|nr:winged helix-turn-helix domain-containing protein [Rhodanobacteraceae bacterium]